jgi:glycosyltransferase involved in cell wall biosynthesis
VVTSKISSLPEVVGEAALTVDPYNIDEISEAMKSILTDSALRARLIHDGRVRAQQFVWEESVSQIHATYMAALR